MCDITDIYILRTCKLQISVPRLQAANSNLRTLHVKKCKEINIEDIKKQQIH